ncbi:MAG TPA: hypothetical protein VG826_07455 [Pirellulales bacterium]|nr:hypothetical protein [Pirellulales bacterium]
MKRVINLLSLFGILAATCLITGCEPSPPSREELGRIVFSQSEVPGNSNTYVLPEHLRDFKAKEETDHQHPPGE